MLRMRSTCAKSRSINRKFPRVSRTARAIAAVSSASYISPSYCHWQASTKRNSSPPSGRNSWTNPTRE